MCFWKSEKSKVLRAKRDIVVYKIGDFADKDTFVPYFIGSFKYLTMRKYLVNYRVAYNPCCEFTAIYEVASMMTQEDVEAFEEAKTKWHGKTATMVSFCELKYSTPTLEDYIEVLPYLTFKKYKLETTDNCWAYIPTLYKLEGTWAIDWIDAMESDSIKRVKGVTPTEAAKNAYAWCVKEGYIKDTLNNK